MLRSGRTDLLDHALPTQGRACNAGKTLVPPIEEGKPCWWKMYEVDKGVLVQLVKYLLDSSAKQLWCLETAGRGSLPAGCRYSNGSCVPGYW